MAAQLAHVPHDSGKGGRSTRPQHHRFGALDRISCGIHARSSRRLAQGISEAMKEFSQEYETVAVVSATERIHGGC